MTILRTRSSTHARRSRPMPRAFALRQALPLALLSLLSIAVLPGCNLFQIVGFVAANAERDGSTLKYAQYQGLADKSYSLIVQVDRVILSEHSGLDGRVIGRVNQLLAENAGASAFIQTPILQRWLYSNPQWRGMTPGEIAEALGVQRLIIIEINEYQLSDPGNDFVWDGSATASVAVVEADSGYPDDYVFEQSVTVTFPDSSGFTPTDISEALVTSELSRRLTDRIAWLFYDHEEPNAIKY